MVPVKKVWFISSHKSVVTLIASINIRYIKCQPGKEFWGQSFYYSGFYVGNHGSACTAFEEVILCFPLLCANLLRQQAHLLMKNPFWPFKQSESLVPSISVNVCHLQLCMQVCMDKHDNEPWCYLVAPWRAVIIQCGKRYYSSRSPTSEHPEVNKNHTWLWLGSAELNGTTNFDM